MIVIYIEGELVVSYMIIFHLAYASRIIYGYFGNDIVWIVSTTKHCIGIAHMYLTNFHILYKFEVVRINILFFR